MSENIVSAKTNVAVWLTLLVLTGVTAGIAFVDLGPLNTVVALVDAEVGPTKNDVSTIAWLRTEGRAHGADPSVVLVLGGSAGGHMAIMCALTGNDPRFQPGFEDLDTEIAGAVALYGYYGPASDGGLPSSPADYVRPDAPPVMLVHGARDPMVPVSDARTFATTLRARSQRAVVWAELPGGLHTFDRFASIRSAGVVAGVEAFADWLTGTRVEESSPPASSNP